MKKVLASLILGLGLIFLSVDYLPAQNYTWYNVAPIRYHNHTCGNCGWTWTHRDNASYGEHFCPKCRSGPWLYKSNRPASVALPPKPMVIQPVIVKPKHDSRLPCFKIVGENHE